MIHIDRIIDVAPYYVDCLFNTGELKRIEVLPLLLNHQHLNGIDQLKDYSVFEKVVIGEMGELKWGKIILSSTDDSGKRLDYDISPEYAYEIGNILV
jgi:hypothetical protein